MIPHYRVSLYEALARETDLTVIASTNSHKTDGINDLHVNLPFKNVRFDQKPESGIFHPEMFELMKKEEPDIIISWTNSLRLLLSNPETLSFIKKKKIKIIWQGCDGYLIHNFLLGSLANFLPWRMVANIKDIMIMRNINHFIAHSSHVAKWLSLVRYVPSNRITVVHNAIDTSRISKLYRKWKRENRPRKKYGIVFTSRLIPGKQIKKLLEAVSMVAHKYPETTLTIVGEGSYENDLKNYARELNIESRTEFSGGIYDDEQLAKKLYENSIFVLPGVGGLSFNTAMAAGLPIIHTYADGTEDDIIREGYNGWFFKGSAKRLADKINHALSNPELLAVMGARSESLITNTFNQENMIKGYLSVIKLLSHF